MRRHRSAGFRADARANGNGNSACHRHFVVSCLI